MIGATYNCMFTPYDVAFSPPFMSKPFVKVVEFFIDITFFMDIVLNFRSTFINDFGEEVWDPH
jgi:hypothetical protein